MMWVRILLTHFTYLALIFVLVLAGTGVPIPEDVPLIFSGYLCHEVHSPLTDIGTNDPAMNTEPTDFLVTRKRVPHLWLMVVAGIVGVLAGDSVVFSIGRRGMNSKSLVARHLRKVMHSRRREKVERHFANHGNWTVFAGRFFPGVRSIVFAFAGMSKMSYPRFLCIDGMASAVSVPLFVVGGYFFADKIENIFHAIDRVKHILVPVVAVLIVGAIVLVMLRRRRRAAHAAVH